MFHMIIRYMLNLDKNENDIQHDKQTIRLNRIDL
jgi:hypothetical protein